MVIAHWCIAFGLQVKYNIKIPWLLGLPARTTTSGYTQPMGRAPLGIIQAKQSVTSCLAITTSRKKVSSICCLPYVTTWTSTSEARAAEYTAARFRQGSRALLEEVSSRGQVGGAATQGGQGWRGKETGWRTLARAAWEGWPKSVFTWNQIYLSIWGWCPSSVQVNFRVAALTMLIGKGWWLRQ